MINKDFKLEVEKFTDLIQKKDYSIIVCGLVLRLNDLLKEQEDEGEVSSELMSKVCPIFDEFWLWAQQTLPYNKWQDGVEVRPWLALQNKLARAQLMPVNYHHPKMYQKLAEHYASLGDGKLELKQLQSLLVSCGRLIGYAELRELDNYPLEKVSQSIVHLEHLRRLHEIGKQKRIMTSISAIFYLIHHHCSVKQLELLTQLIYFRLHTTDEERRSEQAIINSLFNKPSDWQILFAKAKYIDSKDRGINDSLKNISHLLPKLNSGFIRALNEKRWIYAFIYKCRTSATIVEGDLISETIKLLQADFATLKDNSLVAALDFTASVRKKTSALTAVELKILHSALYVFCLGEYEKERRADKRVDSFYWFSGTTKCTAALKQQEFLMGLRPNFGFFETLALKQGRLKSLINEFEATTPILV